MIEFLKRAYAGLKQLLRGAASFFSDPASLNESEEQGFARENTAPQGTARPVADPIPRLIVRSIVWLLQRLRVTPELAASIANWIVVAFEPGTASAARGRPVPVA